MEVLNPATEEPLALCPRADEAQLEQAVAAAKTAFPSWAKTSISTRRAGLEEISQTHVIFDGPAKA
jgi:acyl-CoA reductase-like NAD-dependent aldehyde dehydrogenase